MFKFYADAGDVLKKLMLPFHFELMDCFLDTALPNFSEKYTKIEKSMYPLAVTNLKVETLLG